MSNPRPTSASVRRRAPKRTGRRVQLTVPSELWRAAERLARAEGTTPNDIVVRLAADGLVAAERQAALATLAEERWRAYVAAQPSMGEAELPTEAEAVDAARTLRREFLST